MQPGVQSCERAARAAGGGTIDYFYRRKGVKRGGVRGLHLVLQDFSLCLAFL